MTETAPDRLEAIRAALRELVAEHGAAPLSSPGRMSNLIKDLLPDDQQHARILVVAAEQDVVSQLRDHVSQGMAAPTAIRLVATSFAASTMFAPQACIGVVRELAIATGMAPGESTQDITPDIAEPAVSDFAGVPTDRRPAAGQLQDAAPPQVADAAPSRSRRMPYLVLAVTGAVVVAVALILALRGGSGGSAPPSSQPQPHGTFALHRPIARNDAIALTLTTITVRHHQLTVSVAYRNTSTTTQILTCLGQTDPSASSLTLANGSVLHSTATYCSDHPTLAATLSPGQTSTSYAVFRVHRKFPEPFSFFWAAGDLSGTVSRIRL